MRVGSALRDISPGRRVPLLGYDFRQQLLRAGNDGCHDPLYARALALDAEDGQGPALIITLDLCIVSVQFARHLRKLVAERCSVLPSRVMLCCSHTHSGPWLAEAGIADDVAAVLPHVSGVTAADPRQRYTQTLTEAVVEVATRACGLRSPVDCYQRQVPLGLGYNRRVLNDRGQVDQCWNPLEYPGLRPEGQADPLLSVLTFRQRGSGRTLALWSHGTHPVVLGKTSTVVSADWPGAANALLAEERIEGHFILGACGDVHPWLATQDQVQAVAQVGRAAAAMVALCAASGGELTTSTTLRLATQTVTLGAREVDLMAWNIAGLTVLSSPTELFAPLALELRRRVSGPVMVATNTNGWTGYWPQAAAFAQGGYEIEAARAMGRSPGDSEQLIDHLVQLASEVA